MRRSIGAALLFVSVFCLQCLAVGASEGIPVRSADSGAYVQYQSQIEEAEKLGRLVYEHDQAALVATDLVAAKVDGKFKDNVAGWIEYPTGDRSFRVYFYGVSDEVYYSIYSVDVENGKAKPDSYQYYSGQPPFEPMLLRLAKARDIAVRQKFSSCSRNYNTVGFKADETEYYVYLLTATFDPNEIHVGGHYRFRIAPDQDAVTGFLTFTKSCLTMRTDRMPDDARLAALVMSHILTPYPTEIHVFVSLQHQIDLYVITMENNVLWKVSNGKVSIVERD
jgi:hypothetical protein